jgi:hypothetical protein
MYFLPQKINFSLLSFGFRAYLWELRIISASQPTLLTAPKAPFSVSDSQCPTIRFVSIDLSAF